ncbi:MAG: efflux RND transporter periplasmic adaptor subunit [Gammaproteobacteria bacterium]
MSTVFRQMTGSGTKGAGKPEVTDSKGKARPARLCYVDDSRTSAYVVKRMLRPYGYEVDHFNSAEPALIALVESDYDLLLTDLKVSPTGMDGDDLVRALRASGQQKVSSMPVIVITGATDTGILSQVYEAGANQIMTKPVNGDELDAHIRNLVFASRNTEPDQEFAELAAEADAQDATSGKPAATVVPFGSEKQNASDQDEDSRQVLQQEESLPPLKTPDGRPVPRPAMHVKPAPRVKPIIRKPGEENTGVANQAISSSSSSDSAVPRSAVSASSQQDAIRAKKARELAELKRKAAEKLAKQQAARKAAAVTSDAVNKASMQAATSGTSNVRQKLDAEELKKVKAAAAARKAKLLEQQKAKLAQARKQQQARARAQAQLQQNQQTPSPQPQSIHDRLEPETPLTLEPKDDEPVDVFNHEAARTQRPSRTPSSFGSGQPHTGPRPEPAPRQSRPEQPAASASSHRATPGSTRPQTDPFADAARTAAQNYGSSGVNRESAHAADLFGQGPDNDILQQMDQYPLVQTDFKTDKASGVVSVVSSIVELWGPKKVFLAIGVVVALVFFYNNWSGLFSNGVEVETTLVQQGEIFQSITVPGKVVSKQRVDVTPSIAGRLTNVYVEEGDSVKKDELLARLDDREAKSNLKRAEANERNAEEDVSLAERSLKRLRRAFSKGAVARQLVEEAEVELRSAKARLSVAQEEVRTAKLSLENPRIVAPFAGTITARYVEVGQWVVPSETLFTLVDQSQREVEVRVDAADSGGIAVGQTVTLSSDAFPGLDWQESVTRLAAATSNVGNANTVSVYISLGSSAPSLRFGQQVDAEIRTAWNPSALKVPYGAIINRDGKSYVAVVQDNFVNLVEVETGIEDFTHVEIREGLTVGQRVVLANGINIGEGDRVVIAASN